MGLQDYVNLIGNGFFPIIICGYLLWSTSKHKDDLKEVTSEYKETMKEISTKHEDTLVKIAENLSLMNERLKDIESKGDKHGE